MSLAIFGIGHYRAAFVFHKHILFIQGINERITYMIAPSKMHGITIRSVQHCQAMLKRGYVRFLRHSLISCVLSACILLIFIIVASWFIIMH